MSNVNYVLSLGLVKGGDTFHGKVTIDFTLANKAPSDYFANGDNSKCLFIDYKGKCIKSLTVNGQKLGPSVENVWVNHRIYIPIAN